MGVIFCDIDGTIFRKNSEVDNATSELLPGSLEQLLKWKSDGHAIILTTARPESMQSDTVEQLVNNGVPFDLLIMALPVGDRILINDNSPRCPNRNRALAVNLKRNEGIHF